jgi:hypothetical protein
MGAGSRIPYQFRPARPRELCDQAGRQIGDVDCDAIGYQGEDPGASLRGFLSVAAPQPAGAQLGQS